MLSSFLKKSTYRQMVEYGDGLELKKWKTGIYG